ncbi:reverse transcriptase domain-containing protein, partial [Tanacetum coccineum]
MTFSNPLFDSNDDFTSSDDESLSDEDVPKENFKIYSNPLCDNEEIIFPKIDPHSFNAESNLIDSMLNRDTNISPKFDSLLEEFSGELAHIDPIPPGIEKADFDLEEEIRLVENLSYDNSSPRPPEELNAEIVDTIVESLAPPLIPVEDSDSRMEEIDLFLDSDDSMPPSIENDDYDSEGDIRFLEELLSNNSPPLPENESFSLDHFDDPSLPSPPPEPPDVEISLNFEPDAPVINNFDELNEDECFDPGGGEINVSQNVEEDDSFTFVIRTFLPFLTYPEDSPLLLSSGSEDTIFDPGISTFHFSSLKPVAYENPMVIFLFFCFCPKDKGIRGEIPQDHEDPCLFSILQSSGLRSFAYFGILNPDHVQRIENKAKTCSIRRKNINRTTSYDPMNKGIELSGKVCCATHIEWGDVYRGSGNISENRLVRITFDAVFISSPKISKLHARISCKDGVFFVTNLSIKQGTWIT